MSKRKKTQGTPTSDDEAFQELAEIIRPEFGKPRPTNFPNYAEDVGEGNVIVSSADSNHLTPMQTLGHAANRVKRGDYDEVMVVGYNKEEDMVMWISSRGISRMMGAWMLENARLAAFDVPTFNDDDD